jgi:hypothetical protein
LPHIAGSVPNPKYRTGVDGARSLQVRAQEAADAVRRTIPSSHALAGVVNGLIDEFYVDRCLNACEQYRTEKSLAAQPDVHTASALSELRSLQSRYSTAWTQLRKAQRHLALVQTTPLHRILEDIPPDFAQAAPQLGDNWPDVKTYDDARSLVRQMAEMVTHIEGRLAQLDYAMLVEGKPLAERVELMVEALWRRYERELDSVRQELKALRSKSIQQKEIRT